MTAKFEDRIPVLDEKVSALINNYEKELKSLRDKIDQEEWDTTGYIEAHKDIFFDRLEHLTHEMKETVFDEVKNKKMEKPDFKQVQTFLEKKLEPLKQAFRVSYQKIVKEMLGEGMITGVLKAFDGELGRLLIRLFTNFSQQLDDL